jgi:hypothetical protein
MKKDLEKKVEETMNGLDGLQRAEVNPFLAAKIRQRLQQREEAPVVGAQWGWRLAAIMIVFMVLNFITVRSVMKDREDNSGAKAVATDYSISLPQAY